MAKDLTSSMGVEPFTYVLRWPLTGTIICRCSDPSGDPYVASLVRQLEEGIFADCGAPAVKRCNDNELDTPHEEYVLFYDGEELRPKMHFSDYNIPEGAYIDVVVRKWPCGNDARLFYYRRSRGFVDAD